MISVLISHPTKGLPHYETDSENDYPTVWGAPLNDIFALVNYSSEHELPAANMYFSEQPTFYLTQFLHTPPGALAGTLPPSLLSNDNTKNYTVATAGNGIKDVKGVIMGHLHFDHASGPENFRNTNVPKYTHEIELKHAFYNVATKFDYGAFLPHYLQFDTK